MNTITIICSVAAEFTGPDGLKFEITRKDLNLILQAPEWIQNTTMFQLLAADGSLKAVTSANRVQAENNPTVGLGADGKAVDVPETAKKGRRKAAGRKNEESAAGEDKAVSDGKNEGKDAE